MGTLNLFLEFPLLLFCFALMRQVGRTLTHKQNSKQMLSNLIQVIFFSCVISLSSLVLKLLHCTFSGCSAKINRTDIYY